MINDSVKRYIICYFNVFVKMLLFQYFSETSVVDASYSSRWKNGVYPIQNDGKVFLWKNMETTERHKNVNSSPEMNRRFEKRQ